MLTKSQEKAFNMIKDWLRAKGKLFKLGGPAGSGKSYLIPLIAELVGEEKCLLMTPTGKAANNLQKAGLTAKTIHSCIYNVREADSGDPEELNDDDVEDTVDRIYEDSEISYSLKYPETFSDMKLIIVDEASMVGARLLRDILSFDVPVLLVGDPNQLAPVNDATVYSSCNYYLDEIVRQAQDSPIIWLASRVLEGNISMGVYGSCMVRNTPVSDNELTFADMVLTDTNVSREFLNARLRLLNFNKDEDVVSKQWVLEGDKVICRTNTPTICSSLGFELTNGTLGTVTEIKHINLKSVDFHISNPDLGDYRFRATNFPLAFPPKKRPPKIELGYALTVHLSQGSEWDNVIYVSGGRPGKRALYTAITRAKQSVLVIL